MSSTVQQYNTVAQTLTSALTKADDDLQSINQGLVAIQANPAKQGAQDALKVLTDSFAKNEETGWGQLKGKAYELRSTFDSLVPNDQQNLKGTFDSSIQAARYTNNVIQQTASELAKTKEEVDKSTKKEEVTQTGQSSPAKDDDSSTPNQTGATENVALSASPKPRKNPLGNFASYTYQITLYMITPDAYNAFVESGRRNINALRTITNADGTTSLNTDISGGAFIIAQSGGSNVKEKFQPYFSKDYYIDKLTIKTHNAGKVAKEINFSEVAFTITEPYGFSFLTNLRKATEQITTLSKAVNYKYVNPSKQFYVLGIRFYGYDENGNLVNNKNVNTDEENNNQIFERFFDITIYELKFKLEGKATVYNIKAASTTITGLGTKRGIVKQGVNIQATTVGEALDQLIDKLNYDESNNYPNGPKNKYSIEYVGNAEGVDAIKKATLLLPSNMIKSAWATSSATNTSQSNELVSITATPNSSKKNIAFKNGTSVADVVNSIMKQSNYLVGALNAINAAQQYGRAGRPVEPNPNPKDLSWYNLSVELSNAVFDPSPTRNDWVFDIKYVIQPYATPAIYTPIVNRTQRYYGPHKRYEYFFTGQNSEVISYELNLNTSYFNVTLDNGQFNPLSDAQTDGNDYPSTVAGVRTEGNRLGQFDLGMEAQNQVVTSLYDLASFVAAKLTILGDPDFLIFENPSSLSQVYNQYYGADGYTINANGGQVFIEIDFKEAIDYDTEKGYLSVNDSVLFFKTPASFGNSLRGITHQVYEVTNTFDNGKFTQLLHLALPTWLMSGTGFETNGPNDSSNQRQDSEKEAAEQQCTEENTRTLTTDTTTNNPVLEQAKRVLGSDYVTYGAGGKESPLKPVLSGLASDLKNYAANNLPILATGPIATSEED